MEYAKPPTDILNNIDILKLALDSATNHIVFTDIDGKILYANHGAEIMTGYKKKEIIGKTPRLWGGLMDRNYYKKLWHTIKEEKKSFTSEIKNKQKNGAIYYALLRISPIIDKENNLHGFISTEENITKIKNLTSNIEEQKLFLRKVIDTDPHLLFAKDWDGRFTLANKATADIYGTTPNAILGKGDADFNKNKKEVKHFIEDDRQVIKTQKPKFIPEERVTNTKTGITKWFQTIKIPLLMKDRPRQILGVATDITDRKKYEDIIEIEKIKDEAILESIGEGLIATDENGNINLMNHVAENLIQISFEELAGKSLVKEIPLIDEAGEIVPSNKRALVRTLLTGKPVTITTHYYIRKDKSRLPIEAIVTPVVVNNKIIGTIELFRDITNELEIDRAKTEFVSIAAHQLRAPLTTISWYTELLLSKKNISENDENYYLKQIYKANNRMILLINSLLNVSRIELGTFTSKPQKIDLIKTTKEIINELTPDIKIKNLELTENYSASRIIINEDLELIRIIIQNLLTNAIKYSFPKTVLSLEIKQKDKIYLKITNQGIGIDNEDRARLFSKFFRSEKAKSIDPQGNGLGLYIVKMILEKIKGEISYQTSGDKTMFLVSFRIKS